MIVLLQRAVARSAALGARVLSLLWLSFCVLVALDLAGPHPAAEQTLPAQPSWMKVDAAKKNLTVDIASGWNANNAALNFNGYYDGNMTLVVPVGWRVEMTFINRDGDNPHSIVVTEAYPPDALPEKAGREEAAIKRAYTINPLQGLFAGESDSMRFKVSSADRYLLFCGVPGHGIGGMWTRLDVRDGIDAPFVEYAEGAEPGRE